MPSESLNKTVVVERPQLRNDTLSQFCTGCHYGIMNRVLCEVLEELGIADTAIGITSAGCYGFSVGYIEIDFVAALHGRAPAVATAIKRVHPNKVVFSMQGDGDLGAIGMGHWMSSMLRGENIANLFMNNAGYGQTGGQMAPTTLLGMRTTTTPYGRDRVRDGFPLHAAEIAASMRGVAYSARWSVHTPANRQRYKAAVKKALQNQIDGVGYSFVELLSACPTCWGLNPVESLKFMQEKMLAEYPLGEFKNVPRIE